MFLNLLKDKYIRKFLAVNLIVLGLIWLIAAVKFLYLEDSIILHYDIFKGVDFLGLKTDLFGILFANTFFVFINSVLADFLHDRERFFSYIFVVGSIVLELFLLIVAMVLAAVN